MHLVYEVVHEQAMLYILPINLLRNAALLAAQTPLVAMIDIDLLVSRSFADAVQDSARCAWHDEAVLTRVHDGRRGADRLPACPPRQQGP